MAGQKRLAGAFMIQLNRIDVDPDQPRKQLDTQHIDELTASIKRLGVLQPISLRYVSEIDRYRIIAGECRFTASMKAGLTEIPAWVRTPEENEVLMEQVIENWQRSDLSPFEIAESLGYCVTRMVTHNHNLLSSPERAKERSAKYSACWTSIRKYSRSQGTIHPR